MRIVIVEDSVLLREGIARLLEDGGFEVVGEAGDAEDLMLKVRSYNPDVAIVDIRMPPTQTDEGLRAAKEIRERHPETGVLVLSQHIDVAYALKLVTDGAGGIGYLLKDRIGDIAQLTTALERIAAGGLVIDPALVDELVSAPRVDDPLADLTPREHEVLSLLAEGRTDRGIAKELFVTPKTVEAHVRSIFRKLELPLDSMDNRRVHAVLVFLRGRPPWPLPPAAHLRGSTPSLPR